MCTKGEAAKKLKQQLDLDVCVYCGNDLNDISMFSEAINDGDFIVIAKNQDEKVTKGITGYLEEECRCKQKGLNSLVLKEDNVNSFLRRMSTLLAVLNSERRHKPPLPKYKRQIQPAVIGIRKPTTTQRITRTNHGDGNR